jgi:Ca2+-binding RTX toxin-like protein
VVQGYNEAGIANLVRSGRGVIIAVNAGKLWEDAAYTGNGSVNHAVTLTGAVYDATTGALAGFYLTDSGRGKVADMTRYLSVEAFRAAANVANAYAIYTIEPVKYWEENIAGTGNALDNTLVGNRGDNLLAGMAGNDRLEGGTGNDTYQLSRGDGSDRIVETDNTAGNRDVAKFASDVASDQLWFRKSGNDLEVSIVGTHDQFVIDNWYGGSEHHVEQFKSGDGKWLSESGVQSLVEAMASFAPPAAGQITMPPNYNASLDVAIAANWH